MLVNDKENNSVLFSEPYFEHVLIRSLLRGNKHVLSLVPYIKASYFELEENKAIIGAIVDLHSSANAIPTLAMIKDYIQKTQGGDIKAKAITALIDIEREIADVSENTTESNYVFEQAKNFLMHNRMVDALKRSIKDINAGEFSTVIKRLQDAESIKGIGDIGLIYLEPHHYETIDIERVKSGFHFFDNCLGGGFPKKSLITFAGSQKSGKSMMLINLAARFMLRNVKVLFVTVELSALMQKQRLDAFFLNKEILEVSKYSAYLNEFIATLKTKYGIHSNSLIIKEFPMGTANVNDIRCCVDLLRARDGFVPDVIIIDYIDHTTFNPIEKAHNNNPWIKEGYAYRDARALATELNCCVITAFQRTKSAGNKFDEDSAEDSLGGSVDKTRIADATFVLSQNGQEQEANQLRVNVMFNRYGESRSNKYTIMSFDPARCNISEIV